MTVGIGFSCRDGVAIFADRQITSQGAFKYDERKIFSSQGQECNFIFPDAENPDGAQVMFRKAREGLKDRLSKAVGDFPKDRARAVLEEVFFDHNTEGLQTLIGIHLKHTPPFLFRTQEAKVVDGYVEQIGLGDSSALRYLTNFLEQEDNTVAEASVLGSYIVSVANRYVDGCSGGPDTAIIYADGSVSEGTGGVFDHQEARFLHCEKEIGKTLRSLLLRGGRPAMDTIELEGVLLEDLQSPEGRLRAENIFRRNHRKLYGQEQ